MIDVFSAIETHAKQTPASLAFIGASSYLNYAGLAKTISNIAINALSANIAPGSIVHVQCKNPSLELLTILGLMRVGATVAFADDPAAFSRHGVSLDVLLTDEATSASENSGASKVVALTADWSKPTKSSRRLQSTPQYGALFLPPEGNSVDAVYHADRKNLELRIESQARLPYFEGLVRYLPAGKHGDVFTFLDILTTLAVGGQTLLLGALSSPLAVNAVSLYKPTFMSADPAFLSGMLDALTKTPSRFPKVGSIRCTGFDGASTTLDAASEKLTDNLIAT